MASVENGGHTVPGNLQVFGTADVNGDTNVDGNLESATFQTGTGIIDTASLSTIIMGDLASAPTPPQRGMIYSADDKLYFYNGTDWKEFTFAA